MSDASNQLLTPAATDHRPSAARKVTGRLKRALDLMVWSFKTDNEAAVETGLTISAIRIALAQPHVRAYYRHQLQVLRERESSRNIHRLTEIRDAANNMPAVQAIRMLEQLSDETPARSGASVQLPGLIINIVNTPAQQPAIDVTPQELTHD